MEGSTMILLTVLTILLVLVLVAALVIALFKIVYTLEAIGGKDRAYMGSHMNHYPSLLAKARWGVRAIESQTAAIGPEVRRLNEGLGALDAGLAGIRDTVSEVVQALKRQGVSR